MHPEVRLLRSAVTSLLGIDAEGLYKPAFVTRVFEGLSSPATKKFTTVKAFLRDLEDV